MKCSVFIDKSNIAWTAGWGLVWLVLQPAGSRNRNCRQSAQKELSPPNNLKLLSRKCHCDLFFPTVFKSWALCVDECVLKIYLFFQLGNSHVKHNLGSSKGENSLPPPMFQCLHLYIKYTHKHTYIHTPCLHFFTWNNKQCTVCSVRHLAFLPLNNMSWRSFPISYWDCFHFGF